MTDMAGIDAALSYHLTANHYPPVPTEMIPVAKSAIAAATIGDYEQLIELPGGVTYKDGSTEVPAYVVIESLHLDAFVQAATEEGNEI